MKRTALVIVMATATAAPAMLSLAAPLSFPGGHFCTTAPAGTGTPSRCSPTVPWLLQSYGDSPSVNVNYKEVGSLGSGLRWYGVDFEGHEGVVLGGLTMARIEIIPMLGQIVTLNGFDLLHWFAWDPDYFGDTNVRILEVGSGRVLFDYGTWSINHDLRAFSVGISSSMGIAIEWSNPEIAIDNIDFTDPLAKPDTDQDTIVDELDNCAHYSSGDQGDTDFDGRGNECECTDQNGDGRNTVSDLVAINTAIFNPSLATPLCDGNNDGACNVLDIIAANIEIFSPTNTSTCTRQPVPGP